MVQNTYADGVSNAFEDMSVGSAKMTIANQVLIWNNDRWGSWLVCKLDDKRFELYWWDVQTNKGIDQNACAKVDLLLEWL